MLKQTKERVERASERARKYKDKRVKRARELSVKKNNSFKNTTKRI